MSPFCKSDLATSFSEMQNLHFAEVHKCFFVDREPCGLAPRVISDSANKSGGLHLSRTKHYLLPPLSPSLQNFLSAFSSPSPVFSSICPVNCCQTSSSLMHMFPSSFLFVVEKSAWLLTPPCLPSLNPTITIAGYRHDGLLSMCLFKEHPRRPAVERAFAICSQCAKLPSPKSLLATLRPRARGLRSPGEALLGPSGEQGVPRRQCSFPVWTKLPS